MSAEGMPHENDTLLGKALMGLVRLVVRFPMTTLAAAGVLAMCATFLSVTQLSFRTNRLDLLNPKSEFNQRWLEYIKEFGDETDVVVVAEGPNREAIDPILKDVYQKLQAEPKRFQNILYEIDRTKMQGKGLFYLSQRDLQGIEYFLDRVDPILRGDWSMLRLGNIDPQQFVQLQQIAATNPAAQAAAQAELSRFTQGLILALRGEYQSPWPDVSISQELGQQSGTRTRLVESDQLGIILLKFAKEAEGADFARHAESISRLREIVDEVRSSHKEAKIGLTGLPIIEFDEMQSSKISMAEVSVFEFIGVSLLFIVGFGGWRHPLLAMISLSVGTYWAMGYVALAIGHLNILSSAFAVILIGQGIDFSMYYVAEYLQQRSRIKNSGDALVETVRRVGPGIAIGAVTTAIAFSMAGLTEFTGVAELGIISGGGILLCWLTGVTVLPALIHVTDTKWPLKRVPVPVDVCSWLAPFFAKPRILLAVTMVGTFLVASGLNRLWYDHNLLHMQAKGLESVALEKKLSAEDDLSASFAISITQSPQELLQRKEAFLRLPSVKRVDDIVSMYPTDAEAKAPLIKRIHERLSGLPVDTPTVPVTGPANLTKMLAQMQQFLAGSQQTEQFKRELEQISSLLGKMSQEEYLSRIAAYQQRMANDLLRRLQALQAVSNPEQPMLADLPSSLVSRFVSPQGKFLMKIYSRGDIWDMSAMEQFVRDVRSIDPRATGNPLQVYEASLQMQRSYEEAAFYALIVILPVVYFDFRNLRDLGLAMIPLGLGMLQMFGLMGILNIPLNAANMIVLPLILGTGIDAGVHIVHDYHSQRGKRYSMNPATASAVVINSVTNMAGFGSLMIACHQGLQSLGRVLTIGMSCCLFSSLIILPALLTWLSWNREHAEAESESEDSDERIPSRRAAANFEQFEAEAPAIPVPHVIPRPHWDYSREDRPTPATPTARTSKPLAEFWAWHEEPPLGDAYGADPAIPDRRGDDLSNAIAGAERYARSQSGDSQSFRR